MTDQSTAAPPLSADGARTKVAVLGGGVGAITAAFALTSTAKLRERYEVTVYSNGWRLGGKGASGRNAAAGQRIEEHGLHIWFGFYDNAFRLLRECYEELGRPSDAPLSSLENAFLPHDSAVLWDRVGDSWLPWHQWAPPNPFPRGEDHELPSLADMAATFADWAEGGAKALRSGQQDGGQPDPPAQHHLPHWVTETATRLGHDVTDLDGMFRLVRHLPTQHVEDRHTILVHVLRAIRHELWALAERHGPIGPRERMQLGGLDLLATVLIGVLDDDVASRGFSAINDEELTAWLGRHGAHPSTLGPSFGDRSPSLRALYDMAFAFEGGEIEQANVAAGAAVHGMLRLAFTYKSHLYFTMRAGMGDTIFMPYYEVLKARGVRFEFFTWVDRLRLDEVHQHIETIDVIQQVQLTGAGYDPAVTVNDLPCWPSQPQWDQIVGGAELAERGVNLEHEANPLSVPPTRLERGVDFHEVILGISVGALPPICTELASDAANPAFAAMLDAAATLSTQAFQLWLREESTDLGWAYGPGAISGTFTEPLDTYCDMSRLLERESWPPEAGVRSIAYFCGPQRDGDPHEDPMAEQADADRRAADAAVALIGHDLVALWPKAVLARSGNFDWDLLADPQDRSGPARFEAQYWRGNCLGSERYVLTPAGRVQRRLASDQSGYANLYLAGDWTANGLDVGCVEAATMSGLQAARALSAEPFTITGEGHEWLRSDRTPAPAAT